MGAESDSAKSQTTTSRGKEAEDLAARYLCELGYRIVARNHRCPHGEVDIIAWDDDVLCFVEVRARASDAFGDPLETITRQKIRRIARASQDFLTQWQGTWPLMRFDAVGIVLCDEPRFTLIREAFEA